MKLRGSTTKRKVRRCRISVHKRAQGKNQCIQARTRPVVHLYSRADAHTGLSPLGRSQPFILTGKRLIGRPLLALLQHGGVQCRGPLSSGSSHGVPVARSQAAECYGHGGHSRRLRSACSYAFRSQAVGRGAPARAHRPALGGTARTVRRDLALTKRRSGKLPSVELAYAAWCIFGPPVREGQDH